MKALVIIFGKDGKILPASLELFSAARILADEVAAVCVGNDGQYGESAAGYCSRVIRVISEETLETRSMTSVLARIAAMEKADYILLPGTEDGKKLIGGTAAKMDGAGFTQVTGIECKEREVVLTRPIFSGTIYEHVRIGRRPIVFSTKPGSFAVPVPEKTAGTVECFELSREEQKKTVTRLKNVTEITQDENLEDADIVVAGGRGVGDEDGFRLVKELASVLGGMTGATRMAIDNGWIDRTHQVGQSGKNVSPKLYIACGISGAVQHTCGISDQSFLVAINKDEEAPIFKIADVGIVGDVKKILPEMIREVEKWKLEKA